jgi:hypothetical protein
VKKEKQHKVVAIAALLISFIRNENKRNNTAVRKITIKKTNPTALILAVFTVIAYKTSI